MKNLVIGSEGFVGRTFCEYLDNQGENVVRFDIKRGQHEDACTAPLPLDEVDRVYFLAWDVGGAKYLYNRDSQFSQLDWNLKLMLNVMPQLQKTGRPFLFVSSQLAEDYDSVYGVTKRLGEIWTHLLMGVRVRLWNVYGPLEPPTERSHVISDFVYQAIQKGEIHMMTTGEEKRQFIHIDDVCRAFHTAISNSLPGVYDVSSFEWVSVKNVAKIIGHLTGARVIPGQTLGSTPITPMVGKIPAWNPETPLPEGLNQLVATAREELM